MTGPELEATAKVLRLLAACTPGTELQNAREQGLGTVEKLIREISQKRKRTMKAEREKHDQEIVDATGIRRQKSLRALQVMGETSDELVRKEEPSPERIVEKHIRCYICKIKYEEVHHFYDKLCPACADFNWKKRHQTADLTDMVCLVTGGRIKIGYEIALKLLRARAAKVIVTSRFPNDTVLRFAREPDFSVWGTRLHVYGLDFRFLKQVEKFGEFLASSLERLDVVINNACQTIRRPPIFYAHLLAIESTPLPLALASLVGGEEAKSEKASVVVMRDEGKSSAASSQLCLVPEDEPGFYPPETFPQNQYDKDGQQLDLRSTNSWVLGIQDVSLEEMCEVQAVNTIAPFILTKRLLPLLYKKPADRNAHIINVSSMEGQFSRFKTAHHPHTNASKAGLNMFTRTCAREFALQRVWMNAVDTGWISDENPVGTLRKEFHLPLDEIDGAARVLDPVFTSPCTFGLFLKDYRPVAW